MSVAKVCGTGLLLTIVLLGAKPPKVMAQLGIGIGVGSGYYGGAGFGGFYGSGYGGSHGYYGFGATIWPNRSARRESIIRKPESGYLVGNVNFCPVQSRQKQCAVPPDVLEQTVINAIAKDSRQWVSTQPTSSGSYQLKLLPGTYYVTLSSPVAERQIQERMEVKIPAGQTVRREIQVQPSSL